jgi:tripartite-type tricarboxylate transporter receptor subunit TctC
MSGLFILVERPIGKAVGDGSVDPALLIRLARRTRCSSHMPEIGSERDWTVSVVRPLVGGHILIGSIGLPPALPHIVTGKLRALAVTNAKRSAFLSNLPTVAESGFSGFEMSYWLGLMAPAGTPHAIIDLLAVESVAVLTTRDVPELLARQGAEVITSTPDEFKMLVQKDIEKWSKIIQETGITAE